MSTRGDEDGTAQAVRDAVDALSASQPPVQDWTSVVQRGLARRRTRNTAAAAALAFGLAGIGAGGVIAFGSPEDSLVASPTAPTPRGSTPAAPPSPDTVQSPQVAAPPRNAPVQVAPSPSTAPPEEVSVAPQPDRRCNPAPRPAMDSDLDARVTFPTTPVRKGMEGTATVRNIGTRTVLVSGREYLPTAAIDDGYLTSTYGATGDAVADVPLDPGQERRYRVSAGGYVCDGGRSDFQEEIGPGRYELVAILSVDGQQAVSRSQAVDYRP
jgi:hypothetical protein